MGTTTVGNINQQIAEDRAKLGSPDTSGGTTSSGGLISDLTRAINQIPPCWQVTLGVLVLVGIYGSLLTISMPTGGLAGVAVVLALSDEIAFGTLVGAGLLALGLSRMTDSSHSVPCWTN